MSNYLLKTEDSDDENEPFRTKMLKKFRKFLRLKDSQKARNAMKKNDQLFCHKSKCIKAKPRSCRDYNNNSEDSDCEVNTDIVMISDVDEDSGDEIDRQIRKQDGRPYEVSKKRI